MTSAKWWIRFSALTGLAAFGACSDKGFGEVPKDEAPTTVAKTICEQRSECGCFEEQAATVELCKTQHETQWQTLLETGDAAGLTYDGKCVGRYLDQYDAVGCRTELDADTLEDLLSCSICKVFYGDKTVGEACGATPGLAFFADDCAQGLTCQANECADPCARAKEGEDCRRQTCEDGLHCSYDYDPQTGEDSAVCIRPAGEGEDCIERGCAEGLVCLYAYEPETSAACQRPAGNGEACSDRPCGEDLQCDAETFTCAPAPAPPGPGDPCPGGWCGAEAWCDTSEANPDSWVCQPKKAEGESCTSDEECANWDCDDGVCRPAGPLVCGF